MYESLDLVPTPAIAVQHVQRTAPHAVMRYGLSAAGVIAIGLFVAGLPIASLFLFLISGLALFVGSITTLVGGMHDRRPDERILSPEARALYSSIRCAFADIERLVAEAPRLQALLRASVERCRSAVELAERVALLANPLEHYLFAHDAVSVRNELERLQARTEATRDDVALAALSRATSARARQLAMREEITMKRDQICARLEAVRAELDAFAATLTKLRAVDEEQVVLAGESLADQLDALGDDLHTFESALEDGELAA